MSRDGSQLVEILYFDGCPNHEGARELVEGIAAELGIEPEIRLVEITDAEAAERERFLGSPTIRVDGRDVEPGADARDDVVFACRVYRTEAGFDGRPSPDWVRDALRPAA